MYLTNLHIKNLKLLRDFELSFCNPDGTPRMWTVIIGDNGTGKTSILQAIAMAAAGGLNVNDLVRDNVASLLDKRHSDESMTVEARFLLNKEHASKREYPLLHPEHDEPNGGLRLPGDLQVWADVKLDPGSSNLVATSKYDSGIPTTGDPIAEARSRNLPHWFVAGYGISRSLPRDTEQRPTLARPSIDRLQSLFRPVELLATTWANVLPERQARAFSKTLKDALFGDHLLIPKFRDLELRGQGGAKSTRSLQESHRFEQELPSGLLKLPASWLSHGYQSTLAWIADLIGYILYEADCDLKPSEMEGLVLIDEIDLYLHPAWQRTLVASLKRTFPRLQFVATTHSPLALVGLRPDQDEIVRLTIDEQTGNIKQVDLKQGREHEPDARLMTGSEIYRTYFGIDKVYPGEAGELLREHRYLAADPDRTEGDETKLSEIEAKLRREGIEPDFPRVPRSRG